MWKKENVIGLTFQGSMRRKDSVRILKNNIASYHRMVELKKKKRQTQRQKWKTSFKTFKESNNRYVEKNTGIIFDNFNNLNGTDTDNKNRCPDADPHSTPA